MTMTLDQLVTRILEDMVAMYEFPYHEIIGHIMVLKRTDPENTEKIAGMEECAKYLKRHIEKAKAIDSERIIKRHLVLKQGYDEYTQLEEEIKRMIASEIEGKWEN